MIWDDWIWTVLGLTALSLVRPGWIVLTLSQHSQAEHRRHGLASAGAGALMLTVAIYLLTNSAAVTGRGYWDLAVQAIPSPAMWFLPTVCIPVLCWAVLAGLGVAMLVSGAMRSGGPRDTTLILWALNGMAVCGALLWWGAYLPDVSGQAELCNFAAKGLYLGFLADGTLRLVLLLLGPSLGARPAGLPAMKQPETSWLGRLHRF